MRFFPERWGRGNEERQKWRGVGEVWAHGKIVRRYFLINRNEMRLGGEAGGRGRGGGGRERERERERGCRSTGIQGEVGWDGILPCLFL